MRMQNMQLFIHSYYPVWAMSKEVGDYSIHNSNQMHEQLLAYEHIRRLICKYITFI